MHAVFTLSGWSWINTRTLCYYSRLLQLFSLSLWQLMLCLVCSLLHYGISDPLQCFSDCAFNIWQFSLHLDQLQARSWDQSRYTPAQAPFRGRRDQATRLSTLTPLRAYDRQSTKYGKSRPRTKWNRRQRKKCKSRENLRKSRRRRVDALRNRCMLVIILKAVTSF